MALPGWTGTNPVSAGLLTLASHFAAVWNNVFHGLRSTTSAATTPNDAASYPLANASKLTGKEVGGTERNLAHIDASDDVRLGDTATPTILQSSAQPTWWDGSTSKTITVNGDIAGSSDTPSADYTVTGTWGDITGCALTLSAGTWLITAHAEWVAVFAGASTEVDWDVEIRAYVGTTALQGVRASAADVVLVSGGGTKNMRGTLALSYVVTPATGFTLTLQAQGAVAADTGTPTLSILAAGTTLTAVRISE
jgi:hypothetical protein